MTDQAVTDLKWLGQRLKGVVELVPFLEKLGSLTDHVAHMEKVLQDQKAEYAKTASAIEALKKEEKTWEAKKADYIRAEEAEAQKIYDRMSAETSKLLSEAKAKADEVLAEAARERNAKLAEVQSLEATKRNLLADVSQAQSQLNDFKAELNKLKNKF